MKHACLPSDITEYHWFGRQDYSPLWARLQQQAKAVADTGAGEVIWLCEHEPVYTTGKRGVDNRRAAHLPAPVVHTDRGGEMTFHGPGQLMLYPVVDLRRRGIGVKQYVSMLEQSCIALLHGLGVESGRRCGYPGVWLAQGKIAALGVRVYRGVAYHGMALNVDVDSAWFAAINPCGLAAGVASLAGEIDPPSLPDLAIQWRDSINRQIVSK